MGIEEQIKIDPFNKLWKDNFNVNFRKNEFEKLYRYPISLIEKKIKLKKFKPTIFAVNPGPSLEKNIHQLKNINKRALIICSDVCLYRLIDENIIPDGVATIDPSGTIQKFIKGYEQYTEQIVLFAPTTCSPETLQIWRGPIVFFNQKDPHEWRNNFFKKLLKRTRSFGYFSNLTFVGGTVIQSAVLLGASNIYLVGWDFSSDVNKNLYCKGFLEKRIWTDEKFNNEEALQKHMDGVKQLEINRLATVKMDAGSSHPILYSNQQYLFYKKIFLDVIVKDAVKTGVTITNCTEGGILTEIMCCSLEEIVSTLSDYKVDLNEIITGKIK